MNWINQAIQELLTTDNDELSSRIEIIEKDYNLVGTQTTAHFYFIKLDANGYLRRKDLLQYVARKIVDYSIPKIEKDAAREYLITHGSTAKILELAEKAKKLFTELDKTGELGEMLLYILTESVLKLPQLISKMTLKTSGKLHYQGADGIHFNYNEVDDVLDLYWGESKMEKTLTKALANCFDSLAPFLLNPNSYDSTQNRDLQLITSNISENINNPKLEDYLVKFLDLDSDFSNRLNFKGLCFIGFDVNNYPINPKEKKTEDLFAEFTDKLQSWKKSITTQLNNHVNIEKFEIIVFLMPFDSVESMRNDFLKLLK